MNRAKGKVFRKFASSTVGTSYTAILELGTFNWLTTADQLKIKAGGNANDTAAGTGARTVEVFGLNSDWNLTSETLTLAGASASGTTTQEFIRVYAARVRNVGTYGGTNAGDIIIQTDGGTDLAQITTGLGSTRYGAFSIPANCVGFLRSLQVLGDFNKFSDFRLYKRSQADNTSTPQATTIELLVDGVAGVSSDLIGPWGALELTEKTDIYFEGRVGSATGVVGVKFDVEVIRINGGGMQAAP